MCHCSGLSSMFRPVLGAVVFCIASGCNEFPQDVHWYSDHICFENGPASSLLKSEKQMSFYLSLQERLYVKAKERMAASLDVLGSRVSPETGLW